MKLRLVDPEVYMRQTDKQTDRQTDGLFVDDNQGQLRTGNL